MLGSSSLGLPAVLAVREVVEDQALLALRPKVDYLGEARTGQACPSTSPGRGHFTCPAQLCRYIAGLVAWSWQLFSIFRASLCRASFESSSNLQFHLSLHGRVVEVDDRVRQ